MNSKIRLLFSFFASALSLVIFLSSCQENNRVPYTSVKSLWNQHPEHIRSLMGMLDLTDPALSEVSGAMVKGDTIQACDELLDYYRKVDRTWVINALDPMEETQAAKIVRIFNQDSIVIDNVSDAFPVTSTGGLKWDHTGPDQDAEFAYSLNAQSYIPAFYVDYQKSKNKTNIRTYNHLIQDWVLQHPIPQKNDSIYLVLEGNTGLDYRDIGEFEWRTLDAGRRLGAAWPQTFYGFQQQNEFAPATRLLMLKSLGDQANYLTKYHKRGHNWTTMEMNGLALVGLAFPEFKNSNKWADYALNVMEGEINRQVYPDGVQTEISSKTQWVALRRFESLARNFQSAGREIKQSYMNRIEEMYDFLAYSMRPDGHQALNNDSDREDLRPRVLTAAQKYSRPDWIYIATNGKQGAKPDKGPSLTYPWAGIQVWRNGWDAEADWTFFDHGPYGTGHQHRDKLHLSISSFGYDLLVDGGRYTHQDYFSFDPTVWRGYFRSSFSHNVILVNGQGQNAGRIRASEPLQEGVDFLHTPEFDFARGTFDRGFGEKDPSVVHHRSVIYLKNHIWLVVDQLEANTDTGIEALWHFAPDVKVAEKNGSLQSMNPDRPNVAIFPLGQMDWTIDLVEGQESPYYQGWYSADYGRKVPNPTAVLNGRINGDVTFAWLIIASDGPVPEVTSDFTSSGQVIACKIEKDDSKPISIKGSLVRPDHLIVNKE